MGYCSMLPSKWEIMQTIHLGSILWCLNAETFKLQFGRKRLKKLLENIKQEFLNSFTSVPVSSWYTCIIHYTHTHTYPRNTTVIWYYLFYSLWANNMKTVESIQMEIWSCRKKHYFVSRNDWPCDYSDEPEIKNNTRSPQSDECNTSYISAD